MFKILRTIETEKLIKETLPNFWCYFMALMLKQIIPKNMGSLMIDILEIAKATKLLSPMYASLTYRVHA